MIQGIPKMIERLKRHWSSLVDGDVGSRFQGQYERERSQRRNVAGRTLRTSGGVLLIAAGLFFLAVPGPGLLIMALGAVLIAREFRLAAIGLDRLEVRARQFLRWGRRRWRKLDRERKAATR